MIALIVLGLLVVGLPSLFVCAVVQSTRDDKKDEAKCKVESEAWLKEQMSLPKCKVSIITKGGREYETPFTEPTSSVVYYHFAGKHTAENVTSLEAAKHLIECIIRKERYHHLFNDTYVPLCEIKAMIVMKG